MATLFDLDTLTVRLAQQSFLAQAHGYELLDAAGATVGHATQRVGTALGIVRRHLSSSRMSDPLDFDVTDAEGGVALTIARRKTGLLGVTIRLDCALADGLVVSRVKARWGARPEFTVTDEAEERVYGRITRSGGAFLTIVDPDEVRLGSIDFARDPATPRAAHHGFTIRFQPDTAVLVRTAALAAVIGYESARVL